MDKKRGSSPEPSSASIELAGVSGAADEKHNLSARRIVGFACCQAFIFLLLYIDPAQALFIGSFSVQHIDLLVMLLSMVIGFGLIRILGSDRIEVLLSRPLLYVYAVISAAGSLLDVFIPGGGIGATIAQGALIGVPCALLLTAWGRAFGCTQQPDAVSEIFLGSLVGALLCLLFSTLQFSDLVVAVTRLLPLASVVNIEIPKLDGVEKNALRTSASFASKNQNEGAKSDGVKGENGKGESVNTVKVLSAKILVGTLLFGLAAGLMGLFGTGDAASLPLFQVAFLFFGAFLIGALSLLLSEGFGRGTALNKSYRLAIFLMMVGVLLVPLSPLAGSIIPGQVIVLAGYLGLEVVLIALFVVIAELRSQDCALSFSTGFLFLLVGEFIGLLFANLLAGFDQSSGNLYAVAIAGIVILLGYIFFFTERDFDTLSQMDIGSKDFEKICSSLVERYGLSAREAEILSFALRGRTNERIAQELVIAKSTVDTHLRRIYSKCGVHSRQELLDLAGL